MYRIEINKHEKELSVKLVIYKDYNEMHGQQNKVLEDDYFPLFCGWFLDAFA